VLGRSGTSVQASAEIARAPKSSERAAAASAAREIRCAGRSELERRRVPCTRGAVVSAKRSPKATLAKRELSACATFDVAWELSAVVGRCDSPLRRAPDSSGADSRRMRATSAQRQLREMRASQLGPEQPRTRGCSGPGGARSHDPRSLDPAPREVHSLRRPFGFGRTSSAHDHLAARTAFSDATISAVTSSRAESPRVPPRSERHARSAR